MSKTKLALTIDIDWATEDELLFVYELLERNNVKATWFHTHESNVARKILECELFESGIHPNFYKNSSHGENPIEFMQNIVNGRSSRSHGLYSSGKVLTNLVANNIEIDSSIFIPQNLNIKPYEIDINFKKITRVPFSWADDYFLTTGGDMVTDWVEKNDFLCVMFHPVHIFSNAYNLSDCINYKNSGVISKEKLGIRNQISELLKSGSSFLKLSEYISKF